jgi:LPXTG-motif cell wall-anchored protein
MATRWLTRFAVASTVVGAVTIAGASGAWADPPGNNGTVKINSQDVDSNDDISNQPHVPCDFQVEFFGFDEGQTATITFTIHPPSGDGDVLLSETQTVSDDPAGGGLNDVDAVFKYSGTTFGLDRFSAQPQQGFHVKLTIESAGVPGGKKHKVFWLQCAPTTPSPSPSTTPAPSSAPSTTPAAGALPVTGIGVGGLIATGLAMVGAGAALLYMRRRRAASEGMAEL